MWVDGGLGADDEAICSFSTGSAFGPVPPSSLSCQGAEEKQPVSGCEIGSEGQFPSRCSCVSLADTKTSVIPKERCFCSPVSPRT